MKLTHRALILMACSTTVALRASASTPGVLLIDDFSSDSQYAIQVNDLGKYTDDDGSLAGDPIGNGVLGLQSDGTGFWYSVLGGDGICFDATPYKAVGFKVRGLAGGERFSVSMEDKDASCNGRVGHPLPITRTMTVTTEWQWVEIPLADFGANLTRLAAVNLTGFQGPVSIEIDDLSLMRDFSTPTSTRTASQTSTASPSATITPTRTASFTLSPTSSASPTGTPSATSSLTPNWTATASPSSSATPNWTATPTRSVTGTQARSSTPSPSPSPSPSWTATPTPSAFISTTATPNPGAALTQTALAKVTAGILGPDDGGWVRPGTSPSNPRPGSPLSFVVYNPRGMEGGRVHLFVFSVGLARVAEPGCTVCSGPFLRYEWDGRTPDGSLVASGAYLSAVSFDGVDRVFGKFAILR